ncbi:MAG: 3D domain-containing protein [Verrucomicrobia bacterium]|nr:3D domain-containing protein [Verrucomicrobiota bacterium]
MNNIKNNVDYCFYIEIILDYEYIIHNHEKYMNTAFPPFGVFSALLVISALSSCTLPQDFAVSKKMTSTVGEPLQPGTQYVVRKALAAGVPFRPSQMKQYAFVMKAPHPPMLTAGLKPGRQMVVRTTAYCHDEDDHIVYGTKNAIGSTLRFGNVRSAAADWSRYPVGTLFRITSQPDVTYVVDDYGSALVGTGTIDIYKPSRKQMNDWGVRHVNIEVLQWGSFQRSVAIMKDRMRWPHVRRMVEDIQSNAMQATAAVLKKPLTASL